jgi:hypothetical protein
LVQSETQEQLDPEVLREELVFKVAKGTEVMLVQ